jgi:hypothetical protein
LSNNQFQQLYRSQSDCVGEVFLKAEIQKNGRDDACSYCESKSKTFSIAEMADRTDHAIDQHFYLTSTEPSGLEYAMIKEGDLDWERKGEPIADIIQEYAHMEPGPADDIRSVLEDRHSDRDSELMGYRNRGLKSRVQELAAPALDNDSRLQVAANRNLFFFTL